MNWITPLLIITSILSCTKADGQHHEGDSLFIITENGLKGYINNRGEVVIKPQFRGALDFSEGLAPVRTEGLYGYIDAIGSYVIKPQFDYATPFYGGVAVVYRTGKPSVINKNGTGAFKSSYRYIGRYANNIAQVATASRKTGFININGELIIDTVYSWIGQFTNGIAIVKGLHHKIHPDKNGPENLEVGAIDTTGKFIVPYGLYETTSDNGLYDRVRTDRATDNNLMFQIINAKYGLPDSMGKALIEPPFVEIGGFGIKNEYFFFTKRIASNRGQEVRTGIIRSNGTIILEPVIDEFNRNGFKGGLLTCTIAGKQSYINKNGVVVWQETINLKPPIQKMNVDFMREGYFRIPQSSEIDDIDVCPMRTYISRDKDCMHTTDLHNLKLTVSPEITDTISNKYLAHQVLLTNHSDSDVYMGSQDDRLFMIVQALNRDGEWQDIEKLSPSGCGNSYYPVILRANNFYAFKTPAYDGHSKTRLRIELRGWVKVQYVNEFGELVDRPRHEYSIYSNEYEGSINPGQFWRKQEDGLRGFMDSYDD